MNIQNQKESCAPPSILIHTLWKFHRDSHNWLAFFLLFIQTTPLITAQPQPALPGPVTTKKSMAGVMTVVAILFIISGLLSLYTRNCSNRRTRIRGRLDLAFPIGSSWRSGREPCGLNPEVIDSFPTFLYSSVKDIMIARETLACAVCLDEFKDADTLRLIPTCSHVFHPSCIDVWLESHSTCPVCRANLVPKSEDASFVTIEFPNNQEQQLNDAVGDIVDDDMEYPKENLLNRIIPRSRSTGFLFDMFRRSDSTGHSTVIESGENCERYTLRLPDEIRKKLVNSTLKRTNSCMSFRSMSSGRKGFRTRSMGRNYLHCLHEQFCNEEDQWGVTFTTPFLNINSSGDSGRKSPSVQSSECSNHVFVERSSDGISPGLHACR
ncbi:hypothetical protein Lal_00020333 [Lupinus albus]|uniref:RING-type E3 ubiquitin transferase n=1 Tax=Lupinus albus TaxID=3870 RepID=A0A6A4Q5N9_LUPAL|nr:putative transcription factor C2H2 family [Lupinus albus]KAF1871539.1 hypothetical protein Lal_00020333 [Lupinus albus]